MLHLKPIASSNAFTRTIPARRALSGRIAASALGVDIQSATERTVAQSVATTSLSVDLMFVLAIWSPPVRAATSVEVPRTSSM